MATAAQYGQLALHLVNKRIDFLNDDIRVVLLKATYTPNQDAHAWVSDLNLAANEVSGTGYTAGGLTLTGKTATYDSATNEVRLDADDPTWTNATISGIRYAVYADYTPATDATRPLLCYVNFGGDQSVSGATFTIQHAATGFLKFTAAAES